jgi:copper homeostasis protein
VRKLLEVIACTVEDAVEAELGGADRIELCRALMIGGLTPDSMLVRQVMKRARIPVRVMLRETDSPTTYGEADFARIEEHLRRISDLEIDGLVMGFVSSGEVETRKLERVLALAPHRQVTFHRAFDEVTDRFAALQVLKRYSQVDRILTNGVDDDPEERRTRLEGLQSAAAPEITVIAAGGTDEQMLRALACSKIVREIHVGRAARSPAIHTAPVMRDRVEHVRRLIDEGSDAG